MAAPAVAHAEYDSKMLSAGSICIAPSTYFEKRGELTLVHLTCTRSRKSRVLPSASKIRKCFCASVVSRRFSSNVPVVSRFVATGPAGAAPKRRAGSRGDAEGRARALGRGARAHERSAQERHPNGATERRSEDPCLGGTQAGKPERWGARTTAGTSTNGPRR